MKREGPKPLPGKHPPRTGGGDQGLRRPEEHHGSTSEFPCDSQLPSSDQSERQRRYRTLLGAAQPYLRRVADLAGHGCHFLGVADDTGIMLECVRGTYSGPGYPDGCIGVGLSWADPKFGPNGPAEALFRGATTVIREHDYPGSAWPNVATVGVPVRGVSKRVVAVLCAVVGADDVLKHVCDLLEFSATAIEQRLADEFGKPQEGRSGRDEAAVALPRGIPDGRALPPKDAALVSLSRAARALTGTASMSEVCQALLSEIADFIPGAAVSIFEMDPDTGKLYPRATAGMDSETSAQLWGAPNRGIVGRVFAARETLMSSDLWNDPRVSPHVARPANLRSLIALPLKYRDDCLGVLAVYSAQPGLVNRATGSSSGLLALLETFAAQSALAILAARPLSHLNWVSHKLGLLQESGMALQSTLHPEDLVREVARGAMVVVDARLVLVARLEERDGRISIGNTHVMGNCTNSAHRESLGEVLRSLADSGALRTAVQEDNVVRLEDLSRSALGLPEGSLSGRGMMGCLRGREREPLGILVAWRPQDELPFSELDEQLFVSLVVQAGLAMEKNDLLVRTKMESEKLKTVFHALADGVTVVDPQGRITQINQAGAASLGARPEDFVGRHYSEIFTEFSHITDEKNRPLSGENQPIANALKGVPAENKLKVETAKGRRLWVMSHASPLLEPEAAEPWGAVMVWHDITRDVESEEMQRDLLQVATHELRNPISVLEAYLALLSDERYRAKPGKMEEGLTMLQHNVARIRRMVDNFYSLLRIGTGTIAWNPKYGKFRSFVEMLMPELEVLAAKKDVLLENAVCDDRGGVWDQAMLEQVLLNLIGNAAKFTPPGGKITIRSIEEGPFLHVAVSDTGVGIPPAHASEVFKQFFRVPEHVRRLNPEGSGLGLSISKAIIERHSGTMWAKSDGEGKGTTVHFTLPLAKPSESASA